MQRSVRDYQTTDIDAIINYFLKADSRFLKSMGINPDFLLPYTEWYQILREDIELPIEERKYDFIIWEIDDRPVGHCCIGPIVYAQEAYFHLHLWKSESRRTGHGTYFCQASIARYFTKFHLKKLICEPYARNHAPNKVLSKIGFDHVNCYFTKPGYITYHQIVNRWVLTAEKWSQHQPFSE